jgi:hypothetical protein
MTILWIILKIVAFVFILKVVCAQSQNLIFLYLRKPYVWMLIMFSIGAAFVLSVRNVDNATTVIFWSAALTYFSLLPPVNKNKEERQLVKEMADEMYDEMNIKRGRLKFRIGLSSFVVGAFVMYVICFAKTG